jgi:hypothetical protein
MNDEKINIRKNKSMCKYKKIGGVVRKNREVKMYLR